jgi:hypothetical protein
LTRQDSFGYSPVDIQERVVRTLQYTSIFPLFVAVLLALEDLRRTKRTGGILSFLGSVLILTIPLEFVWLGCFLLHSLWNEPTRLDLRLYSVIVWPIAAAVSYFIWKVFR